jgi:hypothetical protein
MTVLAHDQVTILQQMIVRQQPPRLGLFHPPCDKADRSDGASFRAHVMHDSDCSGKGIIVDRPLQVDTPRPINRATGEEGVDGITLYGYIGWPFLAGSPRLVVQRDVEGDTRYDIVFYSYRDCVAILRNSGLGAIMPSRWLWRTRRRAHRVDERNCQYDTHGRVNRLQFHTASFVYGAFSESPWTYFYEQKDGA